MSHKLNIQFLPVKNNVVMYLVMYFVVFFLFLSSGLFLFPSVVGTRLVYWSHFFPNSMQVIAAYTSVPALLWLYLVSLTCCISIFVYLKTYLSCPGDAFFTQQLLNTVINFQIFLKFLVSLSDWFLLLLLLEKMLWITSDV